MRVAVIGAGLAGLTFASELRKKNIHVEIFEKSRGLGGRLSVKRLPWGTLDIGAQYFTARNPVFKTQVGQWLEDGAVTRWEFTPHKLAAGILEASPDSEDRYVGMPGMNGIAHALSSKLIIHRSTRIASVTQEAGQWTLHSEQVGQRFEGFDWVVSTAPPEQSQVLMANTPVGEHIIAGALLPCRALGIATEGRVEPDIQGFFGDDTVSWVSRLSSKRPSKSATEKGEGSSANTGTDSLNVWMLHFSPEWSLHNESLSNEQFVEEGIHWLNSVLKPFLTSELVVTDYHSHFWRYASPNPEVVEQDTIVDTSTGVAVIGDWLNGGRVEGAYLSGYQLASECF